MKKTILAFFIFSALSLASETTINATVGLTQQIDTGFILNSKEDINQRLDRLKKAVAASKYADATAEYAKVLNQCVACYYIARGW